MATRRPPHPPTDELPDVPEGGLDQVALLFASLAHPARLRILWALAREGPKPAGELEGVAQLEQTALSHQLRFMRDARLVTADQVGRQRCYRLVDQHVVDLIVTAATHTLEGSAKRRR